MKSVMALIASVVFLSACSPPSSPAGNAHVGDTVRAQEAALGAAISAKNAANAAAFYAPDANLFIPGQAPQTTPAAILAGFQGLFGDPNGSLTFQTGAVIIPSSADYVVTEGNFSASYSDPKSHERVAASGHYVTLWRRQDDGSWKIMRDISTPTLDQSPVEAPPPAKQN